MKRFLVFAVIVALLAGYAYFALSRPVPALQPAKLTSNLQVTTPTSKLAWPANQAAIMLDGEHISEARGAQTPIAAASTAKIITALMVLKQKPLAIGQQGPSITITAADVARYNNYVAQDGSVIPVQAGEQITEYQALQALLLPSANNIADKLAEWAYGSLEQYTKYANSYLLSQGLKNTVVGSDASGLDPSTKSTAADMIKIGDLAMQNPVIAQIVAQPTATGIPLTTSVKNVNFLLGTDGIVGIKTGNSDQAGGAFVGAAKFKIGSDEKTIITSVMGAPDLVNALRQSQALIRSAQTNFTQVEVVKKGTKLGEYTQPWGGTIQAVASHDLSIYAWNGSPIKPSIKLNKTSEDPQAGQVVGRLTANRESVAIVLKANPSQPPVLWRLSHPLQ